MLDRIKLDQVLVLLMIGIFFFSGVLLFIAFKLKEDGQTFQVFSGLLTAFSGAFFLRVKPPAKDDHPALADPEK